MAKQKRHHSPEEEVPRSAAERLLPSVDPTLSDQSSLGNQALQARHIAGGASPEHTPDLVRDVAVPRLERSLVALQYAPRDAGQVERLVQIVASSHLPVERQIELEARLRDDAATASAISDAVSEHLGVDTEALRGGVVRLLDDVWSALESGTLESGAWELSGGGSVALAEGAGVAGRAEDLVASLADHLATDELREALGGDVGASVRSFSQAVALAVALDDEEEEEEAWGVEPELS